MSDPRGQARLSIVTAERLELLRKELEEQVIRLKAHGVTTGGDPSNPSRFLYDAIHGLQRKDQDGTAHARGDLNEEYREIYSFVDELRGTEAAAIGAFSEAKLKEIRADAFSIGSMAKRFAVNTISSTLAVFGAGARAVANSEAFQGVHAIAVEDNVMELGEYLDRKSGEAFASATGLDKLGPAGKAIADACGGSIQDLVKFHFEWVHGKKAWNHMFNATTNVDGSRIFDPIDKTVYEVIPLDAQKHFNTHGINRHLQIDRLIEGFQDKSSPIYQELLNIREANYTHGRLFDFTREGFRPTLHAAIEFASWTAARIADFGAGAAVLAGARTKNETDLKYQHPAGFRPPLFEAKMKQGQPVPPTSPVDVLIDPWTATEPQNPDPKIPDTIDVDGTAVDPKSPTSPTGALPGGNSTATDPGAKREDVALPPKRKNDDEPQVTSQPVQPETKDPDIIDVDWAPIDPITRPPTGVLPTGVELKIDGSVPGLIGQRKKDDELLGETIALPPTSKRRAGDLQTDVDTDIPSGRVLITPPPKEVTQEAVIPQGTILRPGTDDENRFISWPGFSRPERESKALEFGSWESDLLREQNKHGKAVTERGKGISDAIPTVFLDSQVLGEMKHLTHRDDKNKLAWIASVERTGDGFMVRNLSIPHQGAKELTSNIYRDEEFRKKTESKDRNHSFLIGTAYPGDKTEIAPSYEDDVEALKSLEGKDFFLRLYTNKRGELVVDVFDKSKNRIYTNVNWKVVENEKGMRPRYQELDEEYKHNVKTGIERQVHEKAPTQGIEEKSSVKVNGDTGISLGHSPTPTPGKAQENGKRLETDGDTGMSLELSPVVTPALKKEVQEVTQQQIHAPVYTHYLGM